MPTRRVRSTAANVPLLPTTPSSSSFEDDHQPNLPTSPADPLLRSPFQSNNTPSTATPPRRSAAPDIFEDDSSGDEYSDQVGGSMGGGGDTVSLSAVFRPTNVPPSPVGPGQSGAVAPYQPPCPRPVTTRTESYENDDDERSVSTSNSVRSVTSLSLHSGFLMPPMEVDTGTASQEESGEEGGRGTPSLPIPLPQSSPSMGPGVIVRSFDTAESQDRSSSVAEVESASSPEAVASLLNLRRGNPNNDDGASVASVSSSSVFSGSILPEGMPSVVRTRPLGRGGRLEPNPSDTPTKSGRGGGGGGGGSASGGAAGQSKALAVLEDPSFSMASPPSGERRTRQQQQRLVSTAATTSAATPISSAAASGGRSSQSERDQLAPHTSNLWKFVDDDADLVDQTERASNLSSDKFVAKNDDDGRRASAAVPEERVPPPSANRNLFSPPAKERLPVNRTERGLGNQRWAYVGSSSPKGGVAAPSDSAPTVPEEAEEDDDEEEDEVQSLLEDASALKQHIRRQAAAVASSTASSRQTSKSFDNGELFGAMDELLESILSSIPPASDLDEEDEVSISMKPSAKFIEMHGRDVASKSWKAGGRHDLDGVVHVRSQHKEEEAMRPVAEYRKKLATTLPESHPLRSILSHVRYLRKVVETLLSKECRGGFVGASDTTSADEEGGTNHGDISKRFVSILESLTDLVSTIDALCEDGGDEPYVLTAAEMNLTGSVGSGGGWLDSSSPSSGVGVRFWTDGESKSGAVTGAAGGSSGSRSNQMVEEIREAVVRFRLLLAVLGEGTSLVRRACRQKNRREDLCGVNGGMGGRKGVSFDEMMTEMSRYGRKRKDDGWKTVEVRGVGKKLDGDKCLNDRSYAAAAMLKKLAKPPRGSTVGGEQKITTDRNLATSLPQKHSEHGAKTSLSEEDPYQLELNRLKNWKRNVDVILMDLMEGSESILSFRASANASSSLTATTTERTGALHYLLRITVPEVLTLETLEGAETICAIAASFVRKRRKMRMILPKTDAKEAEMDELDGSNVGLFRRMSLSAWRFFYGLDISQDARWIPFIVSALVFLVFVVSPKTAAGVLCGLIGVTIVHPLAIKKRPRSSDRTAAPAPVVHTTAPDDYLPPLPSHAVSRTSLQDHVLSCLLNPQQEQLSEHANSTILYGRAGCGKSTLASAMVRNPKVKDQYPDGIVWLSWNDDTDTTAAARPLTYERLVFLYSNVCDQLSCSASSALAEEALAFDPLRYYLRPEDQVHDGGALMEDLHRRFFDGVRLDEKRVLLVLAGVVNLEDLKWFSCGNWNGGGLGRWTGRKGGKNGRSGFQILITSNINGPSGDGWPKGGCGVEVGRMTDKEEGKLLQELGGVDDAHLTSAIVQSGTLETALGMRCAARWIAHNDLNIAASFGGDNSIASSNWWRGNAKLGEDEVNRLCHILNEGVGPFTEHPNENGHNSVGSVLILCFSVFTTLFYDRRPSPNTMARRGVIPSKIAANLWDELLNSDEVMSDQLMALDRCILAEEGHHGNKGKKKEGLVSRSIFITEHLVSLGLLREIYHTNRLGRKRLKGYAVEHEILASVGIQLAKERNQQNGSSLSGFDLAKQRWNRSLVRGCQECMLRLRTQTPSPPPGKKLLAGVGGLDEEESYVMRHIVEHMLEGGLLESASLLLMDTPFLHRRLWHLGAVVGVRHHILDCEALLGRLRETNAETTTNDKAEESFVQTCIIASCERIADFLHQHTGDDAPNLLKSATALYLLGRSLRMEGFRNEAFALFQESLHLSNTIIVLHPKPDKFVHRVLSRTLRDVSAVYIEKGDSVEAARCVHESLRFSRQISDPNGEVKSVELVLNLQMLGEVNFQSANLGASKDAYNDALREITAAFGTRNMYYASTVHSLGLVHSRDGDFERAKGSFHEALLLQRDLLGNDSDAVARTLHNLGGVYSDLCDFNLAVTTLKEAVDVWKKAIQLDPTFEIQCAETLHSLGQACHKKGSLMEALRAYQDALSIRQTVLGNHHDETTQTLHNIGIVYCELGDHEEAMAAYARALQSSRSSVVASGHLHPSERLTPQQHKKLGGEGSTPRQPLAADPGVGSGGVAMQSLTNALWGTQSLHIDAPALEDIQERCAALFGSNVQRTTCASPRIFACASLIVDSMAQKETGAGTDKQKSPGRKNRNLIGSATPLMEWTIQLLPLMSAIVNAELTATESSGNPNPQSSASPAPSPKRRVSFCTYDCSSVCSPVDMTLGSQDHLERTIEALGRVANEIDALSTIKQDRRSRSPDDDDDRGGRNGLPATAGSNNTHDIAKVLLVLHAMSSRTEGEQLRIACSKSMPPGISWPSSRFLSAAALYRTEFEGLLALIESRSREPDALVASASPLRARLSTFVGSGIRFHLRRLFDPVPLSFTIPSEDHPFRDLSACRARVHELVTLAAPEGVRRKSESDQALPLWERPISTVFNLALQQIHVYLQMLPEIRRSFVVANDPHRLSKEGISLSLSQASKRCLEGRSKDRSLNEVDLDDVLADLYIAHTCLSASRASRFVLSLLQWPGVELAIVKTGGWVPIESLSKMLSTYYLDREFPEESHFVHLKNVSQFRSLLDEHGAEMVTQGRASQRVLQDMWKRFKRGSGGLRRKRQSHDALVRQVLIDASSTALFPKLAALDTHPLMV